MGQTAAPAKRYEVLDSLRGICAIMVVLYHFRTSGFISNAVIVRNAYLFVDFFFVLSGFVIARGYGDRLAAGFPAWRFMALRAGRLLPLHWAMLACFLLFQCVLAVGAGKAVFGNGFTARDLIATFFLVQIFSASVGVVWNGPSWSIAAESWIYLSFALLMKAVPRHIGPVCGVIAVAAGMGLYFSDLDKSVMVVGSVAVLRCAFGFSLGVVGAYLVARYADTAGGNRLIDNGLEIAILAILIGFMGVPEGHRMVVLATPLFICAILIFARESGVVSRVLRLRPFLLLGTLSYSIYMVHLFILFRMQTVATILGIRPYFASGLCDGCRPVPELLGDATTLGMLSLVLIASWFTWRFIEVPGQRWSRSLVLPASASRRREQMDQEAPAF